MDTLPSHSGTRDCEDATFNFRPTNPPNSNAMLTRRPLVFPPAQLVSTDNHSNVRNSQHTIAVDVPTLCRDDLVALPRSAGNRLQGTIAVVQRVTSVIQFMGPSTGET